MTGFEIVSVVLAALPLLISALTQYEIVNQKHTCFRKQRLHVDRLLNALTEQKILIESNMQLMFRATGNDDNLAREFEVHSGKLSDLLAAKADASQSAGELEVWKRLKFSLHHKEDFDRKIKELDSCTQMLRRLGEIGMSIHEQIAVTASKKSRKLVKLLDSVRNRAVLLYSAVSPKWALICHEHHSTNLILEDRLETHTRIPPDKSNDNRATNFKLILRAEGPKPDHEIVWHDTDIDVHAPEAYATVSRSSACGVRFALPDEAPTMGPPGQEVDDLCSCVVGAEKLQKALKLM
ncbi:MAG: hypothetical protein Q9160_009316, partial [Pyrenula sp. 1 TL-2023]